MEESQVVTESVGHAPDNVENKSALKDATQEKATEDEEQSKPGGNEGEDRHEEENESGDEPRNEEGAKIEVEPALDPEEPAQLLAELPADDESAARKASLYLKVGKVSSQNSLVDI